MAKGNLFLGYGSGKVGDLVLSRQDGEMVSRARNRHPRNPRTEQQLYSRAVMASVMALYSAGKEIFDHSFQGYAVGAMNQRRFMSENVRLLRSAIAEAIEANYEDVTVPNVTAPGIQTVVFNNWKISEGTYPLVGFSEQDVDDDIAWALPAAESAETPAAYAERVGLIPGDLFTFMVFKQDNTQLLFTAPSRAYLPNRLWAVAFGFVRLRVRRDLATTGTAATLADIFTEEVSANVQTSLLSVALGGNILRSSFTVGGRVTNSGMIGLIRSREDQDLRSTSFMKYTVGTMTAAQGLHAGLLLPVWQAGVQKLGNSELILEGGDF